MTRKDLTVVHQVASRPIDNYSWDSQTTVAYIHSVLSDETRLLRGVEQLLALTREADGIHYGLIGGKGEVLARGSLLGGCDAVETAVIGRHSHSDTHAGLDGFALRHALLVRHRERNGELRVYDLASTEGTHTLSGSPVLAATTDLPSALRLGPCLLVVLSHEHSGLGPRGIVDLCQLSLMRANEPTEVQPFLFTLDDFSPDSTSDDTAHRRASGLRFTAGDDLREITALSTLPHPFESAAPTRQAIFRPTAEALARGVLLGRYERCTAPATWSWDENMSRVHALLFSLGNAVYLADLGSTNGTRHELIGDVRLKHVTDGDVFWLGGTRLTIEACL